MSGTVTKFKFFFAHQDEEQEAWLRAMAQQGLHLVKVNPLCFWTFRRGEPADIVYRLDFPGANQDPAFLQLMQDAGWTLAATTVGWHYWRTPAVRGKAPEMFTDNASKARKFRQLLALLAMSAMPMFVIFILMDKERVLSQLSMPFLVVLAAVVGLYLLTTGYAVLRILLRLRELRGPLQA